MSAAEWHVVKCEIVGNPERGYDIERYWLSGHPSLAAAKRSGLRDLGHDDFNIAKVRDGVLLAWTWMGEDTEPPTTADELAEIAPTLDWSVAS